MRSVILLLFICSAAIVVSFSNSGCANIVPPAGGPRDTIAPVLIDANPDDSTTNFRGNRLTFVFDEFVDLKDLSTNVLFTPVFERDPEISVRQRTVTVRFLDTLDPNTTYIINFGDAITDINESNALQDFRYSFSTGPALDSLEFSGKVVMAETGRFDSTLMVVLYRNLDDSAVAKESPRYITRVDASGNFRFTNLPSDTFAVYALGGTGRFRRYSETQPFAFSDRPVVVMDSTRPVTLYAYTASPKSQTATPPPAARPGSDNRLRFTTNISADQLDLLDDLLINFPVPLRTYDSARISLSTDSTFAPASFTTSLDTTGKQLRLTSQWKEGTLYNLILDRDFATDTAGRKLLKTDTLNFTTRRASDYGKLTIRLRNVNLALNPVLLFVVNDQVVESIPVTGNTVERTLFPPGDYSLRILYDENRNGKWDPGQFFGNKKQPERVLPIERAIKVKPAWENDFDISL